MVDYFSTINCYCITEDIFSVEILVSDPLAIALKSETNALILHCANQEIKDWCSFIRMLMSLPSQQQQLWLMKLISNLLQLMTRRHAIKIIAKILTAIYMSNNTENQSKPETKGFPRNPFFSPLARMLFHFLVSNNFSVAIILAKTLE